MQGDRKSSKGPTFSKPYAAPGSTTREPGEIVISQNIAETPSRRDNRRKTTREPSVAVRVPDRRKRGRTTTGYLFLLAVSALLLTATIWGVRYEIRTSWLQSKVFSNYAGSLQFQVVEGKSDSIVYPTHGPNDLRLGYVHLPLMIDRLQEKELVVSRQSRFNSSLMQHTKLGLYPPYKEKDQAGLQIYDTSGRLVYRMQNPQRIYNTFNDIPETIVEALLFIENRHLLSDQYPAVNPSVDWGRFTKAALVQLGSLVNYDYPSMGGSTLATQIEKYRHSDLGITTSGKEKLVQMISASTRAYQEGRVTSDFRRQLVRSYVNSVPLSAAPGVGEVQGIGDGMYVWYGIEFDELNSLLGSTAIADAGLRERQATIYKEVLSLMIAHRRPSYYFFEGRQKLGALTNSYLRLLEQEGIVAPEVSELAQVQPLLFRNFAEKPAVLQIVNSKGSNLARNRLAPMFQTSVYDLDRMDLTVHSTLDIELQNKIDSYLQRIRQPEGASEAGLLAKYLLASNQVGDISYSFNLFEKTSMGNMVRIQTDTTGLPFDINEGSKLELGSTAKLRTLATYLEIIAELFTEFSGRPREQLNSTLSENPDALTRWMCNWLLLNEAKDLMAVLEAAMLRQYSASPHEQFFTGGGVHHFNNFSKEDNEKVVTVAEALENSINLPFVRIMLDVVNYSRATQWENFRRVLQDDADPRRKEVLDRFIDNESRVYLSRFWQKYKDKNRAQRMEILLAGFRPTPVRLAVIYRYLEPQENEASFATFMRENLPEEKISKINISTLYKKYHKDAFSLQDKGYLASIHPLELWLLDYLQNTSKPSLDEAAAESRQVRRDIYDWLMKTRAKNARDSRVRTVLEIQAFSDIHKRWKRLGYPFDHLVPSLATTLGSSGDKPAGLAELIGIIINNGQKLPTFRFTSLEFAKDTPYETIIRQPLVIPSQVMLPEVAEVLKKALAGVVNSGTGRRLSDTFVLDNGETLEMGGKTGTGDNRIVTSRSSRQPGSSRARNRTATFVFFIGDRHFGTLTAFVTGNTAASYSFTSALPLQVLKSMSPILNPYLQTSLQNKQ